MENEELFPLRVASGKRFCNREQERQLLKNLLKQRRPTVLISPRRYGKTSLACKVIEELKYPFCNVDFLTAYDDESICMTILSSIAELITKIMPLNVRTVKFLEKCFRGVKVSILSKLVELEFTSLPEKIDPLKQVLEGLRGLDILAHKLNKIVVVFIDEFQRVLETEKGSAIQGVIRNVAQTTKNIAFLFSGSARHMLTQVFDDPNQPLYMMCEKIFLERIAASDYISYIQSAAKIRWSQELAKMLIERVLELTEVHPFYVNFLCGKLWLQNRLPTTVEEVDRAWQDCLISEERRLIEELDKLTINQRLLLKEIAQAPDLRAPTAANFLAKVAMGSGTVTPILKSLTKKDMLYVDQNGAYRVLDPLMRYRLLK